MEILYVNSTGGGFAGRKEIAEGTSIGEFFTAQMGGADASSYLIKVNGQETPRSQILAEGDRVVVTPVKVEGA